MRQIELKKNGKIIPNGKIMMVKMMRLIQFLNNFSYKQKKNDSKNDAIKIRKNL